MGATESKRAPRKKEQFMALVEPAMLTTLDVLRVVGWTSRADINRQALKIALPKMRRDAAPELERLEKVAARAGAENVDQFVAALVKDRQRVPSLDDMEAYTAEQLRALLAG